MDKSAYALSATARQATFFLLNTSVVVGLPQKTYYILIFIRLIPLIICYNVRF